MNDEKATLAAAQDVHFKERSTSWSERYRSRPSFQARFKVVASAIEAALASAPGGRVLDYGGGTGVFSRVAAQWSSFTVCIDRSQSMLSHGRAVDRVESRDHSPNSQGADPPIHWLAGDDRCLAAVSPSFDLILAIAVLEYVTDVDGLLQNIARLLGDGGLFLMTVPVQRSAFRRLQRCVHCAIALTHCRRAPKRLADQSYLGIRPHGDQVPWQHAAATAGLVIAGVRFIPLAPTGIRRLVRPTQLVSLRHARLPDG